MIRPALAALAVLTLICGVLYPVLVTGLAAPFPDRAAELVGRQFDDPADFWGRPSAVGYDAMASGGANVGPTNPALTAAVRERIAKLRAADPTNFAPVPIDLVTTSASGLDPHISPAAAYYQVPRIARVRGIAAARVKSLVDHAIEDRTIGILGEPRVSVVGLNRALHATYGQ